jgi:hypothetical protein
MNMTNEASKVIEDRENKAIEFLTRYHKSRTDNSDPLLHLAYSIQELIQIVRWLRIEIDRLPVKITPTLHKYICICGHSRNIHFADDGMCCSNTDENFDCDCLGFEEKMK